MKGSYFVNGLLVILVLAGVYYTYLGGFSTIEFNEVPYPEFNAVVVNCSGYYQSDIGLNEVKNYLNNYSIEGHRDVKLFSKGDSFYSSGEYSAGVILDRVEIAKVKDFENYSVVRVPENEYLVSKFHYKNKLSILVASYRINSFLKDELSRRNATSELTMQIYDRANNEITYLFEVEDN